MNRFLTSFWLFELRDLHLDEFDIKSDPNDPGINASLKNGHGLSPGQRTDEKLDMIPPPGPHQALPWNPHWRA